MDWSKSGGEFRLRVVGPVCGWACYLSTDVAKTYFARRKTMWRVVAATGSQQWVAHLAPASSVHHTNQQSAYTSKQTQALRKAQHNVYSHRRLVVDQPKFSWFSCELFEVKLLLLRRADVLLSLNGNLFSRICHLHSSSHTCPLALPFHI